MAKRGTTRYYSKKQENSVAKAISGRTVANSGATVFKKGDVTTKHWLLECKTKIQDSSTMTVHREWILQNREEAFAMGKRNSAVVLNFGDGENHYIIDEKTFIRLLKYEEEENGE